MKKISQFLNLLGSGGAERVALNLSKAFLGRGYLVDIVLVRAEGKFLSQVPKGCRIIDLKSKRTLNAIPKIIKYIREEKPIGIISHINHINIILLICKKIALRSTKVIAVEHSITSISINNSEYKRSKLIPFFMRLTYRWANNVVAVSKGVAEDLLKKIKLSSYNLRVIYNPIIDEEFLKKFQEDIIHPWFQDNNTKIILSIGRLTKAKDYPTLIRAFSFVKESINAKLIIIGEGEEREKLIELINKLKLKNDVDLVGFKENPYPFIKKSDVFVLSSLWEGFGNVLVEAMACGCPVVSTNCISGPGEILEGGKYGILVPPRDPERLAEKILEILNNPNLARELSEKSKKRSLEFTVDRSAEEYLKLIE